MKHIFYGTMLFIMMGLFGCKSNEPLPVADNVDLERYSGKWYEIAAFPQRFQKGCACTSAEYQLTDKNYIRVINRCKKPDGWDQAEGKAFVQKGTGNAKLKVQFFWPFRGKYWIIGLDEDYKWALVGHPNRDYLWILSRTRDMDETTYQKILSMAEEKNFDTSRLKVTRHECREE